MLSVIRRKKPYTVYSERNHEEIPNVLNRNFHAKQPNQKWTTDITYLTVNGQRMYLSTILDLFNHQFIAYSLGRHPSLEFVLDTVKKAVSKRNTKGVTMHSDQGGQYTSKQYSAFLQIHGIRQSMSRRGNCLDNAVMENFFGHLKAERMYIQKISSISQLTHEVRRYMHFYNHERYQKKLRDMAPVEYRNHITKSA